MSELSNFVFFFEKKASLLPRRVLVERTLAAMPLWFAQPTEVFRLNCTKDEHAVEAWDQNKLIEEPLDETDLLFVYVTPPDNTALIQVLSIEEHEDYAVYTVCIRYEQLRLTPTGEIEAAILRLFQSLAADDGYPVMFSGSEVEWQETFTSPSLILDKEMGHSYWVMAEEKHFPFIPEGFEVAARWNDCLLLRQRDLLMVSDFILSASDEKVT